jgi:hypothetical protein
MKRNRNLTPARVPYLIPSAIPVLDEGSASLATRRTSRVPQETSALAVPLPAHSASSRLTQALSNGPGEQPPCRRSDLPVRTKQYSRGSKAEALRIATSLAESDQAEVDRDSKLATWKEVALAANFPEPFRLSVALLTKVGGILKSSGYRSLPSYVSLAVEKHIMLYGALPADVEITRKKANRSAVRGLGPAKHTRELPMLRLPEAATAFVSVVDPDEPANMVRILTIGSWYLSREIEMAAANIEDVSFRVAGSALLVDFYLPSQKNDAEGSGCTRSHTCTCKLQPPDICPYHLCLAQMEFALILSEGCKQSPFAPTWSGARFTKAAFVKAVHRVCVVLGLQTHTPSGAPLITGHVMRATGAIFLAEMGVELWRIQLLGRWGSEAVKIYIRSAPLKAMSDVALEAFLKKDMAALASDIASLKLAVVGNSIPSIVPSITKADLRESKLKRRVFDPPRADEVVVVNLLAEPLPKCHRILDEVRSRCGWKHGSRLTGTKETTVKADTNWKFASWQLCKDCFGTVPQAQEPFISSLSNSASDSSS